MATFTYHGKTTRPAPEILAFFADMTNAPSWDPSISNVTRLDEGPVTTGSSFEVTLGFLGRDLVLTYEVVTYEVPTNLVLRATSSLFVSEDTVILVTDGPLTHVTYQATLQGTGLARIADPLFKLAIDHFGKQAGAKLTTDVLT